MNWKILDQRICLNLISAIILLIGLVGAVLLYQRAGNVPYGAWGYESEDGIIRPIMPQDSKMYRHNLEVYGGKLNVMMDDFRNWLAGLFHGKSLAVIIGGTAVILSFGFFYKANYSIRCVKADELGENNQDRGD